jgi:hypothetical protein
MKKRILSFLLALTMVISLIPQNPTVPQLAVLSAGASTTPPTVASAHLVTNRFIEINWAGNNYINGAGASKENTTANHRANFEVRLNNTVLTTSAAWYWNINNMSMHGIRLNQNKTTLQLTTALTAAQITAIDNGSSTLDVRITGGVTASTLSGNSPSNAANPAANIGAPGAAANTTTRHRVINRPYYEKNIRTQSGVWVRASEFVHQSTIEEAARMIDVVLSAAPSSLTTRMASSNQFVVFGPGEHSYNIPEHRSIFLRDNWNRAEGYGGSTAAASSANVWRYHALPAAQRTIYPAEYRSQYANESLLAHEFGHGIMNPGMNGAAVVNAGSPTNMNNELRAIRSHVITLPENPTQPTGRRRWQGPTTGSFTYMSSNVDEFAATGVSIWFDAMADSNGWGEVRGPVSHREELRRYCPPTYNFFARVLPEQRHMSQGWNNVPNSWSPFFAPEPAEPSGRYGPSVKIKSAMTIANNPAGSGLQTYIPFNAAANHIPNVELWWDYNTDLMRWFLEPDANEQFFRIVRKNRPDYTLNAQRDNLVLAPASGTSGANIVLAQRSTTDNSQWWRFERQTNGTFVITNRAHPTLAITLASNATSSGTRIVLGSSTTATSRFWNLEGNVPLVNDSGSTAPAPAITTTPTSLTFASAAVGYTRPAAQTITINNTGTVATGELTFALSGTNASSFTLSRTTRPSVAVGGNTTFTVQPNAGLAAGTYTATATITATGMTPRTVAITFTVTAAAAVNTVTFNWNFTGAPAPVTLNVNASNRITNSSAPTLTRAGYTFSGWYTAATGGTQVTLGGTTGQQFTAPNTVLFARWTNSGGETTTTTTTTTVTTADTTATEPTTSDITTTAEVTTQTTEETTEEATTTTAQTTTETTAATTTAQTTTPVTTASLTTATTATTATTTDSATTSAATTTSANTTTAELTTTLGESQSSDISDTSDIADTSSEPPATDDAPDTSQQPDESSDIPEDSTEPTDTSDPSEIVKLLGDVNLDGEIDIQDALEILKFLAGINNVIEHGVNPELSLSNALITGESDKPTIGDALEILKYIAGMDNKLSDLS